MTVALSTAVARLDGPHHVGRAGAADHEELVAAGVLDGRHDADALVVVVVPDGVDLRRCLQQVGRGLLAGLDGELGGDAVVDVETALGERVLEALAAVLGQRQRVDAGDLGDDGVGVVAELLADVVCRPRRPCRSCRRGSSRAAAIGSSNTRSTLMTGIPASIASRAIGVSAAPSNGSSTMASTPSLMNVSTWLICRLTSLVPSATRRSTSSYSSASARAFSVMRGHPAVVGGRRGEADDDGVAGLVVRAGRVVAAVPHRCSSACCRCSGAEGAAPRAPATRRSPRLLTGWGAGAHGVLLLGAMVVLEWTRVVLRWCRVVGGAGCRVRARYCRSESRKPLLEQHGGHDDRALGDGLRRDGEVVEREDVGQRGEDQDAEDGADDGAAAAREQRAADDDRGDRVELVELAVGRGAGRGAGDHHHRGDAAADTEQDVEQHACDA